MTDEVPIVSIIVTVRNNRSGIQRLAANLQCIQWPPDKLEVCIVDGASDDGTWEELQRLAKTLPGTVRIARKAGGIGVGRNAAVKLSTGDFLAVTDADMEVPTDWIRRLMAGMTNAETDIVGAPNDGASSHWLSRGTDCIPIHGPSLGEIPVFGASRFQAAFTTNSDVFAAVTRNCMYRRSAFIASGGFNEDLVTTEDGELHARILAAGGKIRYEPSAGVMHHHRATVRSFFRQMRNYARGQAHANQLRPSMRRIRHALPSAALICAVSLALAAPFASVAAWLFASGTGMAILAATVYGIKAGVTKRSLELIAPTAFLFLIWQLAWSVGFLEGKLGRGRRGAHT